MKDLPLLIERVMKDPKIKTYEDLASEFSYHKVEPGMLITRVNELTELKTLCDMAIKQYTQDATDRLVEDYEVAGFKWAPGRKARKYTDEERVAGFLQANGIPAEHAYEKKLIGVPAMEKLLKAEVPDIADDLLAELVTTTETDGSAKIA